MEKMPVIVVLDQIRSGLNVGAIFRTCDAFNVQSLFLCGITVQPPHAEILKTALGATDSVQWKYFKDTESAIAEARHLGFQAAAVEQTHSSIMLDQLDFHVRQPLALIFGNEMKGVQPEILALCDFGIEIPQSGIKHSLNVATTAGIVLWECYRHHHLRRFSSAE
jgi:tRNA G18 (ribose-2'-O)-methylase SpoU